MNSSFQRALSFLRSALLEIGTFSLARHTVYADRKLLAYAVLE